MYYYCPTCGIKDEERTECKCLAEAIYYPNDEARPAEYDDLTCIDCGAYVMDYCCDECLTRGNPDDQILDVNEKNEMICHKCNATKKVAEALFDLHESLMLDLTTKFGFNDDADTHEYVEELIECRLRGIRVEKILTKPFRNEVEHKQLDKIINAWLDENYDIKHKSNSIRKHLQAETVEACQDIELKKKYWNYLKNSAI